MDKLRTSLRRFGYFTKKDFLTIHNIATAGAIILGLVFTYNAVTATTRNWQLEQKLKERTLESAKLEIEVETLTLEKQYFNTDEYQEIMARKKQNKMLPGETMVILPNNSEKAKTKYSDIAHPVTAEARTAINESVLAAYNQELSENESLAEDISDQDLPFEQDI